MTHVQTKLMYVYLPAAAALAAAAASA
jgi:hypothetical protein